MKVPFARRQSDGYIVGVADVARGKAADCVCLSCGRPVMARQGTVRVWHFAHLFASSSAELCAFSVNESIREAVLWLLPHLERLRVPAVRNRPGRFVEARNIEVRGQAYGVKVDARVLVDKYELFLFITYKGRPVPSELANFENNIGILDLEIEILASNWAESAMSIDRLRSWLEDEDNCKRWVDHPLLRHDAPVSENSQRGGTMRKEIGEAESLLIRGPRIEHHCVICQSTWVGDRSAESATCRKCDSHLYVSSTEVP